MTREEALIIMKETREVVSDYHRKAFDIAIKALEKCEVWDGIHGQVVVPKGTFDKIYEEAESEEEE